METPYVHVVLAPPVGKVLLNHGARKNILSVDLVKDVAQHLRALEADPQINVILLGSTSPDVFSAGVDIRLMAETEPDVFAQQDILNGDWRVLDHISKPVIAVVQGYCLGGGLELALMADIMVLSTQALLGFPEVTLGLIPGLGGTQRLSRLIGTQRAAWWVLSGKMFSASEAFAMGVGTLLVEDDQLWATAEQAASTIASHAHDALHAAKKAIRTAENKGLEQGLEEEKKIFYQVLRSPQARHHLRLFLEKKSPSSS